MAKSSSLPIAHILAFEGGFAMPHNDQSSGDSSALNFLALAFDNEVGGHHPRWNPRGRISCEFDPGLVRRGEFKQLTYLTAAVVAALANGCKHIEATDGSMKMTGDTDENNAGLGLYFNLDPD